MNLLALPDLVTVFLYLPGGTLHKCRQVCRGWNKFILNHIWSSQAVRQILKEKLETNWLKAQPVETITDLDVKIDKPCILSISEDFVVAYVAFYSQVIEAYQTLSIYTIQTLEIWKHIIVKHSLENCHDIFRFGYDMQ